MLYISRLRTSFQSKRNATKIKKIVYGVCSVNNNNKTLERCIFFKNGYTFRRLKLDFSLAIPALNEEILTDILIRQQDEG